MADSVTLSKDYFHTLLRRADFHVTSHQFDTPIDLATVNILKVDHDALLRMTPSLRRALLNGGLEERQIELLVNAPVAGQDGAIVQNEATASQLQFSTEGIPFFSQRWPFLNQSTELAARAMSWTNSRCPSNSTRQPSWRDETDDNSFPSDDNGSRRQGPELREQRTLTFRGLPDRFSHADVAKSVRGGALLDVYLRPREKMASVSFVEPEAAQKFLAYAKRDGLYLRGRRIDVAWNDRQFHMSGHVRRQVFNGASRNLVIHNAKSDMSEESIRDDLDHIHNLVVLHISFKNGDAYISTNSVHNALFARTCMMSRLRYKNCKIDFYPDECAEPLPQPRSLRKKEPDYPLPKARALVNPFELLSVDDTDEESSETDDSMPGYGASLNVRAHWVDAGIAA